MAPDTHSRFENFLGPDGQMKQENFSLKPRSARSKITGSLSVKLQYLVSPGSRPSEATSYVASCTVTYTFDSVARTCILDAVASARYNMMQVLL